MSAAVAGGSPRRRGREWAGASPDRESASVKVESDVDIKDYAETTMNELLGWYGYDKVDTRGLNLKGLQLPSSSSSSSPMRNDDDFSEDDTARSGSPPAGESESIASNAVGGTITCAWCLKTGLKLFTLKTSSGKTKAFCSEPCFNQCRRAAFKKNRVCNWCRHVRHTVNYVDFKDGDDQLQFCSDKCLNQYKMQIFCRETQAYLQMNPHLQEESDKRSGGTESKLITPDLWLRDCHESVNGERLSNLSHSDDEGSSTSRKESGVGRKPNNGLEVEDLTLSPNRERSNSISANADRRTMFDSRKTPEDSSERRSFEVSNALASYLKEDRDRHATERKKRHHESDREHYRKRQKISLRHRSSHPTEAPPAHLSSVSPLRLENHSRHFPHSSSPLLSHSGSSPQTTLNPPAAHTKALPPHPSMSSSMRPPGLPPPPPLLNNDFMHSPFNPSFFQTPLSPQQHMDAVMRMQSRLRPQGEHFPPHLFPESMFPHLRSQSQPHPASLVQQPNTVMLPYPMFVPVPVPIPVPIPLENFLLRGKKQAPVDSNKNTQKDNSAPICKSEGTSVESAPTRKHSLSKSNSKSDSNGLAFDSRKDKHLLDTPYAVVNDTHTNRLILTRNKTR